MTPTRNWLRSSGERLGGLATLDAVERASSLGSEHLVRREGGHLGEAIMGGARLSSTGLAQCSETRWLAHAVAAVVGVHCLEVSIADWRQLEVAGLGRSSNELAAAGRALQDHVDARRLVVQGLAVLV